MANICLQNRSAQIHGITSSAPGRRSQTHVDLSILETDLQVLIDCLIRNLADQGKIRNSDLLLSCRIECRLPNIWLASAGLCRTTRGLSISGGLVALGSSTNSLQVHKGQDKAGKLKNSQRARGEMLGPYHLAPPDARCDSMRRVQMGLKVVRSEMRLLHTAIYFQITCVGRSCVRITTSVLGGGCCVSVSDGIVTLRSVAANSDALSDKWVA